jgi:hypothetical protein
MIGEVRKRTDVPLQSMTIDVDESLALRVWHLVMVQRVGVYTYGPGENMGEKRRV